MLLRSLIGSSSQLARATSTVATATLTRRRWFSEVSSVSPPTPSTSTTMSATTSTKPKKWKKATKRAQHIINQLEEEQVSMAKVRQRNWPDFKPGDAIQVRYRVNKSRARLQQIRGIVLGRKNRGMGSNFLLHNIIDGTPFEIRFPLHSPLIEDIQMIQPSFIHKGTKRMKRAKLNYLRDHLPSSITVKDTMEAIPNRATK